MKHLPILLIVTLWCAVSGLAQTLTIGNVYVHPHGGWQECDGRYGSGHTDIDLAHPATKTGSIFQLGFALGSWSPACQDAVAIRFFRRNGDTLTMTAERGPFSSDSETKVFTVSPAVKVEEGDLIGITPMTECGCVVVNQGDGEYLQYDEDLAVGSRVSASAGTTMKGGIAVWGTGGAVSPMAAYPELILPVVGSGPGAQGSNWKTAVQLHNPHAVEVAGRLVFHRASVPGSITDAALPYSLSPGETQAFDDIVSAMGEHGAGSIDVVTDPYTADGVAPVVVAHVFHERDDGGTLGVSIDAFDPSDPVYDWSTWVGQTIPSRIIHSGDTALLIAPVTASRTRLNIGVRTLGFGARLVATLLNPAGEELRTVSRDYPPTYLKQLTAKQFFGIPLSGGESIRINVLEGSAIVYGASIDNLTNDPMIQFAYSVFVYQEK